MTGMGKSYVPILINLNQGLMRQGRIGDGGVLQLSLINPQVRPGIKAPIAIHKTSFFGDKNNVS